MKQKNGMEFFDEHIGVHVVEGNKYLEKHGPVVKLGFARPVLEERKITRSNNCNYVHFVGSHLIGESSSKITKNKRCKMHHKNTHIYINLKI